MKTLIWLDDSRDPNSEKIDWLQYSPIGKDVDCIWIKSYKLFVHYIMTHGLPDAICFDHDLGKLKAEELRERGFDKKTARRIAKDEITGYDCALWLIDYCTNKKLPLPKWNIQSSNPVGKENIKKLLENYENLKSNNYEQNVQRIKI